jgi:anti-sigma regulatory factor (Ser/Thr protein kinase)
MVSRRLPKERTAPAEARRMLDRLARDFPRGRLEDARLLVSEVVTNAVEHVEAEGDIAVTVVLRDSLLRIEVEDPGSGFVLRDRDPDSERGWGLQFVQRLADRWGVDGGERNQVWFELAA